MSPAVRTLESLGELLEQLGGIDPHRVRLSPAPGKAKEIDVVRLRKKEKRLYELVDGVMVEKVMGAKESWLATELIFHLRLFLRTHPLGKLLGADGTLRLLPGLIRIPDISLILWDKLPGKTFPADPIPNLVPDLAIEVLSASNTKGEMQRKVKDYFLAGVAVVWLVDPKKEDVRVFTAPDNAVTLTKTETLTVETLLPGFALPLAALFDGAP